ncbi:MAG: hypothetical protein L0I95_10630 [Tetragenococcus koreensis]|nr:hypothetical protein [Tetragenococcus koreensis]MDN6185296.1 hypothetical protein [Tetragenococcus halophilus]MDN6709929.1 hypothetical protein [Tetragenococcus halophilus]MDN6728778.1 hypothetical protein [Alkalibacterium sp.]MDN6731926.1 hypothetical protein [Tetragenococcus koreensis]
MTQETEKERIYREALDEINNLAIDVAMDFEETGIDSVDCGKIMDIVNKAFFVETNQQPSDTDKLSVEKLQEQLNTAKNALTEIAEIIDDNIHECNYGCDNNCELNGSLDMYSVENVQSIIDSTLAAIGGDDD